MLLVEVVWALLVAACDEEAGLFCDVLVAPCEAEAGFSFDVLVARSSNPDGSK